jgi:hypothetical protein
MTLDPVASRSIQVLAGVGLAVAALVGAGCSGDGSGDTGSADVAGSSAGAPLDAATPTQQSGTGLDYRLTPAGDDPRSWFSEYEVVPVGEGSAYLGLAGGETVSVFACGPSIVTVGPIEAGIDAAALTAALEPIAASEGCSPPSVPAPTECLGLAGDPRACDPDEGIGY